MNRNGDVAIILIYLMTILSVFMNGKLLVCATSAPASINLYSMFKDQLNASSNFAEMQYNVRTAPTMNSIYDMTKEILREQLKQQQWTEADSENGNYADKLVDEANLYNSSHVSPPPAVASPDANTTAYVAKKNCTLINASVVVSSTEQSNHHRQAHKTQKASRRCYSCPPQTRKSYFERSKTKRQSSMPTLTKEGIRPLLTSLSESEVGGTGEWELSPPTISTQSWEGKFATMENAENMKDDDDCRWRNRRRNDEETPFLGTAVDAAISKRKLNGLPKSIGKRNGDDGSHWHKLSNVKWRRKLQIDGKKNNLLNSRSWPNLSQEQSNQLIESDEDVGDEKEEKNNIEYESHAITSRSIDSFPEVFSQPLVESSSIGGIPSGVALNEVIRNADTVLKSIPNIVNGQSVTSTSFDSSAPQSGKKIQPFDAIPINGQNLVVSPPLGDARTENLTNVMEKVLGELESLKECKAGDDVQPEGSPCDVVGSWNSEIIGLEFHISISDSSMSTREFVDGKKLEIEVTEKIPPRRRHDFMDCDWYLTGNAVKQVGGPFYITGKKEERSIVATFAGLCKHCGGIPTIFGSWTFIYPAKDCQDISLAIENKRDVFRKDNLEIKRKHRREKLVEKDKSKCLKCSSRI